METLTNFGLVAAQLLAFLDPMTPQSPAARAAGAATTASTVAVPARTVIPIPYVSDLILTLMNLSALHPLQQQQVEASFLPQMATSTREGRPENSEHALATEFTWKDFNNHFLTFLCWLSTLPCHERSRDQKFIALRRSFSSHSWRRLPSTPARAGRLSPHKAQLLWLVVVMQSVAVYSAHMYSSSPTTPRMAIPSNWPLISSLTEDVKSFSGNLKWANRLIAVVSLWNITTDAYDLFQKKTKKMLQGGVVILPWNEKSLWKMSKTDVEVETENYEFDGSKHQSVRLNEMEEFVKSFVRSEYFLLHQDRTSEGVDGDVSVFVEKKLDAYNTHFVDQLLRQYFAMFGMELPPVGGRRESLTSPTVSVGVDVEARRTHYYGKDRFVSIIGTFEAFLTKICNFSEAINLKRLKSRIILPKTGVLKLFVENSSFSTAIVALHQARICIGKFGAGEAFSKLGISKLFPLASAVSTKYNTSMTGSSGAIDPGANLTKSEQSLFLWASIVLVYLPLLVTSFASPKALKHSERKTCITVVTEGFDRVWKDISDLIENGHPMLNQNVASGVLVLLFSLVLYDGVSIQLKAGAAQAPPAAAATCIPVSPDDDGKLVVSIIQKVMDNVFNGLQLKINVMNETCIGVLLRMSSDLYAVFRSLHASNKLNRGW